MDPEQLRESDIDAIADRVAKQLPTGQYGDKFVFSRRQVMALAASGLSVGALTTLGVDEATAQDAVGAVGTDSDRVDVFANDVTAAGDVSASALETGTLNNVVRITNPNLSTSELQARIDEAPEDGVIVFDSTTQYVVDSFLNFNTVGLRVIGLNAKLDDGAFDKIAQINEDNIEFSHFRLEGNKVNNDPDTERNSTLFVSTNTDDISVHHGWIESASRHGVELNSSNRGASVERVWGTDIERDVVSLSPGDAGTLEYPTIKTIRCYNSEARGAVEIADGVIGATVEDVYAEDSVYAVDHEDHGESDQINEDTTIRNVRALNCDKTIDSQKQTSGPQHSGLIIDGVWGDATLEVEDTDNVTLRNVNIFGATTNSILATNVNDLTIDDVTVDERIKIEDSKNVSIETFRGFEMSSGRNAIDIGGDCENVEVEDFRTNGAINVRSGANQVVFDNVVIDGFDAAKDIFVPSSVTTLTVRNLTFKNLGADADRNGLRAESCDNVTVDGVVFEDAADTPDALNGVRFDGSGSGVFVHNVRAYDWGVGDNIRIAGTTSDYIVTENIADVNDGVSDTGSIVEQNIAP